MPYILNIIYFCLLILISPFIIYRMIKQNRYREGWGERLGFTPVRNGSNRCIWVHAVSMGEVNAAATIVESIRNDIPDCDIVVSTTTDTGINRARKLYGEFATVVFYPFDFTFGIKRAFNRLRPDLCILMELEAWPNFTKIAQSRNIPVVVANGRISSGKGFPRYKKIAWLIRPMFGRLAAVMVQDAEYAERFEYLGVAKEKIFNVGSLKYDTAEITDKVSGSDELAEQIKLEPEVPLIVAGSTGVDEEKLIIDCFRQVCNEMPDTKLRLAIIPRKPEKFGEVAELIKNEGYNLLRYSEIKSGEKKAESSDNIILGDTMGDLRKFYSLASIIFVGRSLVPMGGSDMMEAAALAKPVIVGPYTENFMQTITALKAGGGIIEVKDQDMLTASIIKLLKDDNYALEVATNGRQVIIEHRGATARTIEKVRQLL